MFVSNVDVGKRLFLFSFSLVLSGCFSTQETKHAPLSAELSTSSSTNVGETPSTGPSESSGSDAAGPQGNGEGYSGGNSAETLLNAALSRISGGLAQISSMGGYAAMSLGNNLADCPRVAGPTICKSLLDNLGAIWLGKYYILDNLEALKAVANPKHFILRDEKFVIGSRLVIARTRPGSGIVEVSIPLLLSIAPYDPDGSLLQQVLIHEMVHSINSKLSLSPFNGATMVIADETELKPSFAGDQAGARFADYIGALLAYFTARQFNYQARIMDFAPLAYYPMSDGAIISDGREGLVRDLSLNGQHGKAIGTFGLGVTGLIKNNVETALRLRPEGNFPQGGFTASLPMTTQHFTIDSLIYPELNTSGTEQLLFLIGEPQDPNRITVTLVPLSPTAQYTYYGVRVSSKGTSLLFKSNIGTTRAARITFGLNLSRNLGDYALLYINGVQITDRVIETNSKAIMSPQNTISVGGAAPGMFADFAIQHLAIFAKYPELIAKDPQLNLLLYQKLR